MLFSEFVAHRYFYVAEVLGVHDGDTFKARVDLGDGVFRNRHIRIVGMDTPELNGSAREREYAKLSLERLDRYFPAGEPVFLQTFKDRESLDRLLAVTRVAEVPLPSGDPINLKLLDVAQEMVKASNDDTPYAVAWRKKGDPKWRDVYAHLLNE